LTGDNRASSTVSGDAIIRYADDTIVGFQHEHEAKAFLHDLQERMREFELALHPAKTRLIRFGRHAAKQREEHGEGKPERYERRHRHRSPATVPSIPEGTKMRTGHEKSQLTIVRNAFSCGT
jgi:hypothetical protein